MNQHFRGRLIRSLHSILSGTCIIMVLYLRDIHMYTVLSHPDDTVSSIAPLTLLDALRSHNWTIDFHQQVKVVTK